jgi:hypothetical protein
MPGIDTILENVHSPLNSTQQSRRKRLHFEDDDNGGDQDKEIRDIEDSFAELNINGIENDNDMESSIDEEYKYNIQILPSVLRNLAESNQDNTLRNFIKLVHEKKFPQENIAFTLWCDLVKWYGLKDTRGMQDSTDTLNFFGVGWKLFGGRFVRFMSGLKNETSIFSWTNLIKFLYVLS